MHEFPDAQVLSFLVGWQIGQIVLDPWSLQFRCENGGTITVEGKIEHVDESGAVHPFDCQDRQGGAVYLHQLLQKPLDAIDVQPLCLSLMFANGAKLRIFSELIPYECGHIATKEDMFVF